MWTVDCYGFDGRQGVSHPLRARPYLRKACQLWPTHPVATHFAHMLPPLVRSVRVLACHAPPRFVCQILSALFRVRFEGGGLVLGCLIALISSLANFAIGGSAFMVACIRDKALRLLAMPMIQERRGLIRWMANLRLFIP